ncbi:adenylyl-sulfate kinase [Geobacillus sp. NFOSA3]|uniref:Adenylyl-sulfate kinase n=1 Tax=Parageobacillus toebii NBRC 107807 TaxID=1223503 RepID=A0A6G9J2X9_9BACL|nr:adenylyl-sulfate kinase [Parageobacillus toebii]NNU93259.1 adenylyl-sulfate kinase [Geobacillus sp. NFOSA3]MBB3868839.1 adenylylsulfate kinase [Parageobacillus toebii NBRC 107807]MED4970414.1 adenylyl-sulfate kinase [Parageobacillus toebii]QIQ32539.1 adenylyl-sulfate kinase [Parageobacillus toebii NBRC 107807]QSB48878.1 adenylyl-sulfate kinase [Parageobacillus toebii]
MSTNIVWHQTSITKKDRRKRNGHHSAILWFTGLSGSGKSTIANAVSKKLFDLGIQNYVLDGDNIRHGLNKDLGFSVEDRTENIRRIGEVAKLFVDSGQFVLTAFISPFAQDRELVRNLVEKDEFIEIYVKCPLEECERRDPKGLYKKARNGEIRDFTGIDSPYEAPVSPELILETDRYTIDECANQVLAYLRNRNFIKGEF